ncbi:MAG TPA: AAA family ATPase [Chloroflexota bacterium]|nr:AAA family ATPase [Chloroflexota bacterium]
MPSARRSLRTLDLAGFKSFARPTHLEIPDGITAFVGANGSGKSNIVDAVRWCLGEQSARDLRTARAEDVIHAGPRRVLGSAEVRLGFEGSSDLSVARRVFRSGDSEYLLQGERRRLRDVHQALRAAAIDNPRFVVVNQGMADFLLASSPAERRALLEQAAGLAGYRQSRDEAVQKLGAAEQNLATIEIVLAELEPRVRLLRRQARALEEKAELEVRLRHALLGWHARRWNELTTRRERVAVEVDVAATARDQAAQQLRELEDATEEALAEERRHREQREAAIGRLHALEREIDVLGHAIDRERRAGDAADAARVRANDLLVGLRERLAANELEGRDEAQRLRTLQSELADAEAAVPAAASRARDSRLAVDHARQKLAGISLDEQRLESEIGEARRREAHLRSELSALENRQARDSAARSAARAEHDEIASRLATLEKQRAQRAEALDSVRAARRRASEVVDQAARYLQRVQNLERALRQKRADLDRDLSRARSAVEQFPERVRAEMLAALDVPPGWERAVAAALDAWSSEFPDLPDGFHAWRSELDTRADATWADEITGGRHPALAATLVVDDDAAAARAWQELATRPAYTVGSPPLQVVSRQGVRFGATGRHEPATVDQTAHHLEEINRMKECRRRRSLTDRRLSRIASLLDSSVASLATAQAAAEDEATREQAVRDEVSVLVEECEAAMRRLQRLSTEVEAYDAGLAELRTRHRDVKAELVAADRAVHDLSARLETCRAQMAGETRAAADLDARAEEHGREVAALEQRIRGLRTEIAAEHRVAQMRAEEAQHLADEIARTLAASREAEEQRRRADAALGTAIDRHARLQAVLAERTAEVAALNAATRSVPSRELLGEVRAVYDAAVARHETARARWDEARRAVERAAKEVIDDLRMEPEDLPPAPEMAATEHDIRRLRVRLAQAAEVDPAAATEYAELEQRRTHLCGEISDLRATADGLREIMNRADAEMATRFGRALSDVDAEFRHIFRTMMRGGDARLEQVDEAGGLDVRAHLPGKRARSSASFSGGERALVATSLLFAVLRTRPAPFCVLDEVDAALDETNVDRYLDALRDVATRTQALVVTHNRATMSAANVLYGLTMDGEGVSSVLSLRLDEYRDAV